MNDTLVWIIVAAVVVIALVVIIALVVSNSRKKANRERAQQMRAAAQRREEELRHEEAKAAETEAAARKARAEADEKAARAERLEMDSRGTAATAGHLRQEQVEQQRQADKLDPDVRTNRRGERLDTDRVQDDRDGASRRGEHPVGHGDGRHDPAAPVTPTPRKQPQAPVEDQGAVPPQEDQRAVAHDQPVQDRPPQRLPVEDDRTAAPGGAPDHRGVPVDPLDPQDPRGHRDPRDLQDPPAAHH